MELMQAILERRSVRQFTAEPVPQKDIEEILEAARWAPSGSNKQNWKFIVVKNQDVMDKMSQAVSKKIDEFIAKTGNTTIKGAKAYATFFNKAPVTIAVFMEPYETNTDKLLQELGYGLEEIQRLRGQAGLQSIGATIQNLILAAHAKGYGTCWMCASNIAAPEIEKILGVEEPWTLKALIPLGKPARVPKPTPRKGLSEIMEVVE